MNLILFLGRRFVANESDADLLVNKLLVEKVASLRNELNEKNIELPLIRIKDWAQSENSDQIAEGEISLECDGVQKWKQDFSSESFEDIVYAITENIKNLLIQ